MLPGSGSYSTILDIQPPPNYWNTKFIEESSFSIPLSSNNEIVDIDLNNPPETEEILEVLVNERPPVKTWNILALHYLARRKEEAFLAILERWLDEKVHGRFSQQSKDDEAFCMDLLANYYALKYAVERDRDRKKEYFNKAQKLYTQVEKLFVYSQYHLVGRAYFCMFDPEKIDQAATQFEFVLTHAPADSLALQGRGIVAFQKGDYKKALSCFKKILQHDRSCSPDIRMAIGHCLFKLNRYDKAKLAYQRTLEMDDTSVGARVGMALILLNEGTKESVKKAMDFIVKVYSLDKTHPINLNLLADHFFYRKETEKAISLSAVAIQTSNSEMLKAESAYMLGRSHHFKAEYDQAFQYYYQATQFAEKFVLPWYGLGQMYLFRGENQNAIQCFEKVLAGAPNNVEALKMLGLLYLTVGPAEKRTTAKSYLKKVIEMCPEDIDAHIKYAELQESTDRRSAKEAYMRVVEIYKKDYDEGSTRKNECPAEILNNISVICFHLGELKEARKFLEWAKLRAEEERQNNEIHYASILVTMTYNEGRINEAERLLDEAHECYTNILKDHLNYVDCYLRFGCLARDKGNILQASDWFKEAGVKDPDNADSHLLLGNLHMSKAEYGPAQKKFEKILSNPKTKKDTYALLSLGNIWLESLYTPTDTEKKKRHAERAFQLYRDVLKIDPTNVYAVNGMGAILAKTGQIEEAREMFNVVRESTGDILDLWLNIGHAYCDQKQYVAGITMYENAMKRFREAALDPQVFLYLARAYYFNGDLPAARRTLQIGRKHVPQHQILRYNLAVVMKRAAVNTLKDFRSSLDEVNGAITDLKAAQNIFESLSQDQEKHIIDPKRAEKEAKACADFCTQSEYHVDRAKKFDEDAERQRENIEKARKDYQERILLEQKQREEMELREKEELLKRRQEILQRAEAVKENIIKSATAVEEKPSRKRPRRERGLEDGFIDDGMPAPANENEPKRKRRKDGRDDPERKAKKSERRKRRERQREEEGVGGQSSSEDEQEPQLSRKDLYDSKGRKYLSKAYISDSEDTSSSGSESGDDVKESKRAKNSSGEESDRGVSAQAGKAALASSDEEAPKTQKKRAMIGSDDEADQPTKSSARVEDDDDDRNSPPPTKGAGQEDDVNEIAKLSLDDSDSE